MSIGNFGFSGTALRTPNKRFTPIYTYNIVIPPATLPVSLIEVKEFLKLDLLDISENSFLTLLIQASSDFFQKYTNRILINTTFETFFDCFRQSFELARSKFQSLIFFQYLQNGSQVDVDPTTFYITFENDYSRIIISLIEDFPDDKDDRFQSIIVRFVAGFGDTSSDIPADIRIALLNQIASLYENRGDCNKCDCGDISNLPTAVQNTYNQYRIMTIYGSPYRG